VVLSTAALLLLFLTLRRLFGPLIATTSVLILAVNPSLVRFAGSIMSETPYIFFVSLCLYLVAMTPSSTRHQLGSIAAAIAAALTRTAGITLIMALALHWLLEWRWKRIAALLGVAVITVGAWLFWTTRSPERLVSRSYVADAQALAGGSRWITPLPQRIGDVFVGYVTRDIPHTLALPAIPGTPIDNVLGIVLVGAAALAGLWVFLRKWRPAALYTLCYGALLLVWVWATDRFVIPLLMILVPATLVGASTLVPRFGSRAAAFVFVLAALLGTSGAVQSVALARSRSRCVPTDDMPARECLRRDQVSYFDALRYIRASLPQDAVLLTSKPGTLYFYTGRRTVSYRGTLALDSVQFLPTLRAQGTTHILLGSLEVAEPGPMARLVSANCSALELVERFPPRTYLFRLAEPPTPEKGATACAALAAYRAANAGRDFDRDP
jgi:hypothetical protein